MSNRIDLSSKSYSITIVHVNDVTERIINIPHYSAAQQWANKVSKLSPKMVLILDVDTNAEYYIGESADESNQGGDMFAAGQIHYICDKTGRRWWN